MYKLDTRVTNKEGLHTHHCAVLTTIADKYLSRLVIHRYSDDEVANAKSVVMTLSMGLRYNDKVEIIADGPDEKDAVEEMTRFFENGFSL